MFAAEGSAQKRDRDNLAKLADTFDHAGKNGGITICAKDAAYCYLVLKSYIELLDKLNGIWRK